MKTKYYDDCFDLLTPGEQRLHAWGRVTVGDLVDLSGITGSPGFRTLDYAVPINKDGTYPYDGNAISVYRESGIQFEIIPYYRLARMAIVRIMRRPNLNLVHQPVLEALRKI